MGVKRIALTGGIGSGKSFVCSIFKSMGIPVYNSDNKAKKIMRKDETVVNKIKKLLGNDSYHDDGKINTQFIANSIFRDKLKLQAMNEIVHPAVRDHFERWTSKKKDAPFVINEAALFVDNGSYKDFDKLITVVSPLELRLERVVDRDKSDKHEVLKRMANQSTDERKMKLSDYVIYNDHTDIVLQQCVKIYQSLNGKKIKKSKKS